MSVAAPGGVIAAKELGAERIIAIDRHSYRLALALDRAGATDVINTKEADLTDEILRNWASGDIFGMTQDVGMGWNPARLGGKEFLILSTAGGLRADDGSPIALGGGLARPGVRFVLPG